MDYKQLEVWKTSKQLSINVYLFNKEIKENDLLDLKRHVFKTAVSVSSNIAEGLGRFTAKDKIRFLVIARGSLFELETQLIIMQELDKCKLKNLTSIFEKIEESKKLVNGMINYLNK